MKNAFNRYADFIREFIYKKGWNELREVQEETCSAILDTNKDIILASPTASGKTEAVFFPILTELEKNPSDSISVLYIGPLKALINDQFKRLTELLEDHALPVWAWHGDISYSKKQQAKEVKKGIIQITPESLESLLMHHPDLVRELFADLRYVVIDEIHSLMGTDRGLQILCQIERIQKLTKNRPRRIGLSATLADYSKSKEYLSSGRPENVLAVGLKNDQKRKVKLRIDTFDTEKDEIEIDEREDLTYLYNRAVEKKTLIFSNSRKEAEEVIQNLKNLANIRRDEDIFYVHHGSISSELRHEAENVLKTSENPAVVGATITLELGIDIGNLDQIIQIGAPFSCASFVQRLGRSGRTNNELAMRFINYHTIPFGYNRDVLPWDLLRSIAIVELYLKERWIEPFTQKPKPFSLLVHQTLSTLATYTELQPRELARNVLTLFPFKNISQEEYKIVLKHLIKQEYIQQLEEGTLIIGLKGERLINHYSFYAVFTDSQEYKVMDGDTEVGSISFLPEVGDEFSLAGKSWHVSEVDAERNLVYVNTITGKKSSKWAGSGIEIHERIIKKIREILDEDISYPYLSEQAKKSLEWARACARENAILDGIVWDAKKERIYIYPWSGTVENRTLLKLLENKYRDYLEITRVEPGMYYFSLKTDLSVEEFVSRLKNIDFTAISPEDALGDRLAPRIDKYDKLLPESLRREAYLANKLDITGAKNIVKNLEYNPKPTPTYISNNALTDFLTNLIDDYFE